MVNFFMNEMRSFYANIEQMTRKRMKIKRTVTNQMFFSLIFRPYNYKQQHSVLKYGLVSTLFNKLLKSQYLQKSNRFIIFNFFLKRCYLLNTIRFYRSVSRKFKNYFHFSPKFILSHSLFLWMNSFFKQLSINWDGQNLSFRYNCKFDHYR